MDEERLTKREQEIIGLLAAGNTNPQIASTLGIGRATVKWYVSQILRKLQLPSRVDLAVYAYSHGLLTNAASTTAGAKNPPGGGFFC